ncbi:hypothetical protein LR48_Vigan09g000200 [Vigna angularis]|uniref:Major facilitator superfamily (MFS) profile domain-containing protein n=1 Tax=Phaseolus angularis TaxID=3914 RepID=A0A0L9V8L0_PHAAN|nr:hypothetical protein LR48_Vigan09g000200 [Vigna angularis]
MVLTLVGLPLNFDSIRNQILFDTVVPSYDTVSEQLLRYSIPHMFGHSPVPPTNSFAFYFQSSYRGGRSGNHGGYHGQHPCCIFCQQYGHIEAKCHTKERQQHKTTNVAQVNSPKSSNEVAPTKYRGALGSLCQIGTCLGIITSLILGIPSKNDPHWWRTMLYIASIPGILVAIGMQFTVDSPRWLCKAGRINDAKTIIRELWGESKIDSAIEEFQSVCNNDGCDSDSRWSEILEEPHSRVAFIGGALFVLQQFAGINGVLYFSSLTFQEVGVESSAVASLFVGLTNFAGAVCALYLIDREGRQKLLIGSYLGMVSVYRMFITS